MGYNRHTLKHFACFLVTVAVTFGLCVLALRQIPFPPPPQLPPNAVEFPAILLSPPTTTGAVLLKIAQSKPQTLWNGAVIWQSPGEMMQQSPSYVILRVEKGRLDSFEQGLDKAISRKREGVDVATRTEAQLSGEDFGVILEEANARKLVGDNAYQEWRWQVTPKSPGPHRLVIVVSPIVQVKDVIGGDINAESPFGTPFRDHKDVDVSRNWPYFFREQLPHWTNIAIGAVIGTAIAGIIGLIRKRMNRSSEPPPNPEW